MNSPKGPDWKKGCEEVVLAAIRAGHVTLSAIVEYSIDTEPFKQIARVGQSPGRIVDPVIQRLRKRKAIRYVSPGQRWEIVSKAADVAAQLHAHFKANGQYR